MRLPAYGVRRRTHAIFFRHSRRPALHAGVVDALGSAPGLRRLAAGFHSGPIALRERDDFVQLLFREREPGFELRIEACFEVEIDRRVKQRARWSDPQSILTDRLHGAVEQRALRFEIGTPHVPPVNHAG